MKDRPPDRFTGDNGDALAMMKLMRTSASRKKTAPPGKGSGKTLHFRHGKASGEGGRWVTMEGTHVHLGSGGQPDKGPAAVIHTGLRRKKPGGGEKKPAGAGPRSEAPTGRGPRSEAGQGRGTRAEQPKPAAEKPAEKPKPVGKKPARKPTPSPEASKPTGKLNTVNMQGAGPAWKRLFGDKVTPEKAGELLGVASGGDVKAISHDDDGVNTMVILNLKHPKISSMSRIFDRDAEGKLYCHNDTFFIKKEYQGDGFGSQVFADQVKQCAAAGVAYIETTAIRGEEANGYYTWPRFGYDAKMKDLKENYPAIAAKIKAKFPQAKSVLDVMATPEGREWWKKNGTTVELKFDLKKGSRSQKVLAAYLAEREKQGKGATRAG